MLPENKQTLLFLCPLLLCLGGSLLVVVWDLAALLSSCTFHCVTIAIV